MYQYSSFIGTDVHIVTIYLRISILQVSKTVNKNRPVGKMKSAIIIGEEFGFDVNERNTSLNAFWTFDESVGRELI
jgi:hypothetical protein